MRKTNCLLCQKEIIFEVFDRNDGRCSSCCNSTDYDLIEKQAQECIARSTFKDIFWDRNVLGLCIEELEKYEKFHDITIPDDLRSLLLYRNGGGLHPFCLKEECLISDVAPVRFDVESDRWHGACLSIADIMELSGQYEDDPIYHENVDELARFFIISGDGHHYVCLDYREGRSSNGIVAVELECGYSVQDLCRDFKDLFAFW